MTKEQLSYINGLDSKKEIKNQINEWFGVKELELGKWYRYGRGMFNYQGVKNGLIQSYGILQNGNWIEKGNSGIDFHLWELATSKEIEEALKNEAIKRGFVEGARTICISVGNDISKLKSVNTFRLTEDNRLLIDSNDYASWTCVFKNGKWAKVLETITKEEAEKQLGKIIV